MRATWFVWCVVASVTWSTHATYSIVAINSTDGAVGAAAASCSGKSRVLSNLYAAIPGHGAVVTQVGTNATWMAPNASAFDRLVNYNYIIFFLNFFFRVFVFVFRVM